MKLVKDLITSELRGRYSDLNSALWVEIVGVDGITTNEFRRELRDNNMRLEIVKSALFRRAVKDTSLQPLADKLEGPAAIMTGGESLIDVAKLVDKWLDKIKSLKLRGAILEGEFLDEARVGGLSKMPTKADLQARIVGQALSPGANLAAAILSGGANVAGALKAMIKKLEDGEQIVKKSA
ncbi:MAG: 50S ribosomal protein L10 [Phycisphaerales bacterium]|nr:50S ribosomal protein L10 [Phycisphaerales bacterium]